MKKIILFILFLIGIHPVFKKGEITISLVQASYANGFGSEEEDIAFCAGMDIFGNSMCEVETDCSTGSIINVFSCIDIGGGDDGGNNGGGEDPCYYNCDDGGYPGGYDDDDDGYNDEDDWWNNQPPYNPPSEPNNPPQENEVSYLDIISLSVAHGSVYPELIDIADKARLGTLKTDWNSVVNATIDRSLLKTTVEDWNAAWSGKGVAILSTTGKILGVTSAVVSIGQAWDEFNSPEGLSLGTALDVGVSIGSLFVKSNVVGFGISAGWFIIKESW